MKLGINAIIYDKKGRQILEKDLLKVYHFGFKRKHYMYHVATKDKDGYWKGRCYTEDVPHYNLAAVTDENYILKSYEIINMHDWETKRQKIKI